MSLGGEKSIEGVRKWSLKGGRAKGKGLNPFFLSGGSKDAKQPGKKKRFGGVSKGRWWRAHYA